MQEVGALRHLQMKRRERCPHTINSKIQARYKGRRGAHLPYAHALVATYLLTGGRHDEVLGLELDDISFDRHTIAFRPNRWRRLKTRQSRRTVPLWPQLEVILREYVFGVRVLQPGTLLFPSFEAGQEAMISDVRKLLDRVAVRSGFLTPRIDSLTGHQHRKRSGEPLWEGRSIRTRIFRHTYCSARL
jgi:integrase